MNFLDQIEEYKLKLAKEQEKARQISEERKKVYREMEIQKQKFIFEKEQILKQK